VSAKILFVFDAPTPLNGQNALELLKSDEFSEDYKVFKVIQSLGHEVVPFAIFDNLGALFSLLTTEKYTLIFHQAETYRADRAHESHLAAFYQLVGIPHTGASSEILALCSDKSLAKKILSHHRIRTPFFETFGDSYSMGRIELFPFPGIVKPLNLEGSEGISQMSFVSTPQEAIERAQWIRSKLGVDAIFEEYIDGRELYVALLGGKRPASLPIREHFFGDIADKEPKIATYNAKWNDDYRKKWGIKNGFAKNLSPALESKIQSTAKRICRILGIHTFARIDFRMKSDETLYFIEANPNPCLYADDELAMSAIKAGITYSDLIEKIINEALTALKS
jgi:D-alanine-D-alanine ligase